MNKFIIGLLAAATLSTAALANDRTEDGTIASRSVYNGAVWADRPLDSGTQGLAVKQGLAVNQGRAASASDFSFDPRTGIRNGNDSK